jgi:hypothetical protein
MAFLLVISAVHHVVDETPRVTSAGGVGNEAPSGLPVTIAVPSDQLIVTIAVPSDQLPITRLNPIMKNAEDFQSTKTEDPSEFQPITKPRHHRPSNIQTILIVRRNNPSTIHI